MSSTKLLEKLSEKLSDVTSPELLSYPCLTKTMALQRCKENAAILRPFPRHQYE